MATITLSKDSSLEEAIEMIALEQPFFLVVDFRLRAYSYQVEDLIAAMYRKELTPKILGVVCHCGCEQAYIAQRWSHKVVDYDAR